MQTTETAVQNRKNAFMTTKDMALTAMFAVLIAVCSWISIPLAVPITLQTFGVFCALAVLGGKRGFFAVLVYILLGAAGLPVFAGFKSGIGTLFGSTGGYIVGFLLMAGVYWLAEKFIGDNAVIRVIMLVAGLALCYLFGTVWFVKIYTRDTGAITMMKALNLCVIPFLIWDGIKLAAALGISETLKRRIKI
ncbi:biotin transporter BioY [Ruminococcus sp.]|uniref:biotin transporter BioY n=1 Tax=Ruminococcus sp. TaxID=41978 RepID=UPI0025F52301|nr:biotin transporter BioY [Ruminococcus sp.]